jgi:hypothetical protein
VSVICRITMFIVFKMLGVCFFVECRYPGFAYVDQPSTGAHRSSVDASCPSSVEEMSSDAFKRLSISGSDTADNKYHKRFVFIGNILV